MEQERGKMESKMQAAIDGRIQTQLATLIANIQEVKFQILVSSIYLKLGYLYYLFLHGF